MTSTPFQAPSPDLLAELLPQYSIDSFIAQGGMGAVYKGRQASLDRDVAIKVLPKELGGDTEFRESFITEAKAMAKLNHPNLLGVFDYGDVEGMPYIVMEYVECGSLHEAAWNQAIDPTAAVGIVKGICDGLTHAHESGIVHRDIKPSNILLTSKSEPKVADFGLAHSTDSEESGIMMGTPGYTAPEVFHDPNQAGTLADMYSVGVILHQLLTGIDPAGSQLPPTKLSGNIRLDAIWRKATNPNPSQRYRTMADLSTELGKWLESAGKKLGVTAGGRPYTPPKHPTTKIKSGGGGMFVKLLIIAGLGAAVYYTYTMLEEQKTKIDKAISDAKENEAKPPIPKIIHAETPPNEIPKETADVVPPEIKAPIISFPEETTNSEPAYTPGNPELRARAVTLIANSRTQRDKKLADNVRELLFQIGAKARSARADDVESFNGLKDEIVDGRIPDADEIDGVPTVLQADFEYARSKEESIISAYESELTKVRDFYVARLIAEENSVSDPRRKANLKEQADQAKDLEKWIDLLNPE